jgi:hypothetical protein
MARQRTSAGSVMYSYRGTVLLWTSGGLALESALSVCDGDLLSPGNLDKFSKAGNPVGNIVTVEDERELLAASKEFGSMLAIHNNGNHTIRRRLTAQECAGVALDVMMGKPFAEALQLAGQATGPIVENPETPWDVIKVAIAGRR